MQRAQTSRSGGQTEEQQRETSGSRSGAEDDRVRIRVSGRQIDNNESQSEEGDESAQANQSGKKKGVKWAEGVVDNEHMCKKKSKKCCIFHKRREFGEWSDDSDSEDDTCSCHGH